MTSPLDPPAESVPHTAPPPVPAADFVVFGGTGDLAARKLLPALYLRDRDGQLPAETRIIALSRAGLDDDGYRDKIRGELSRFVRTGELDEPTLDRFIARLSHVSIDIEHDDGWPLLVRMLDDAERIRVFYLAIGPSLFGPVSRRLAECGLVTPSSRLVLEKPIGHDLPSALEINDAVGAVFEEKQIFRIDHYLG
ncbi:MAG: zwf [Marmoricola sp.]|nr:zwf [Marmoricola sp.]